MPKNDAYFHTFTSTNRVKSDLITERKILILIWITNIQKRYFLDHYDQIILIFKGNKKWLEL